MSTQPSHKATARQASTNSENDWIKIDLHIHTLMIPKTPWIFRRINYWNGRARLDSRLAITCTMLVFDRKEVFAGRGAIGILLIPQPRWFARRRRECV